MKQIFILCTGNSCRSQMAEGLLKELVENKAVVHSAGTKPCFVHPMAIQAMNELGVDISDHRSKSVTEFINSNIDIIITVCGNAEDNCPTFPGNAIRYHWPFEDPAKTTPDNIEIFRNVRDTIKQTLQNELERILK